MKEGRMAYVYISDDGPDAEEFESNYIAFDPSDERKFAEIRSIISAEDCRVSVVRNRLETVCESSLSSSSRNGKEFFSDMIKRIVRFAGSLPLHRWGCDAEDPAFFH
jgi:hypothetical protein